jgi:hypothetical protein
MCQAEVANLCTWSYFIGFDVVLCLLVTISVKTPNDRCMERVILITEHILRSDLGNILTHDNLRRRCIVVVEWCVMCKKHGESVDHLLLHCDVARVVWSSFYSLFGVEWVMPSSVLDLLSGWGTLMGRGPVFRIWKQVPFCVLWSLWRERNSKLFEDVEVLVGALCRNVLNMLYLGVSAQSLGSMSFADCLFSCSFLFSD